MSVPQPCHICGIEVYPTGNVHADCNKLLVAGMSIEAARLETTKANLYALSMKPVLMKAANRTAILTVAYLFLASIVLGVLYAIMSSAH